MPLRLDREALLWLSPGAGGESQLAAGASRDPDSQRSAEASVSGGGALVTGIICGSRELSGSTQKNDNQEKLIMAHGPQRNEEMEEALQNGEEHRLIERGQDHQAAGNNREQAQRLAPDLHRAIPDRQVEDAMGRQGEDMEMFMEEMREIRRKLRELQLRNGLRIFLEELSKQHKHHDELCLMP